MRFIYLWAALFCGIPLVMMGLSVREIHQQQRRLASGLPVRATVLSTDVEEHVHHDDDGTRYTYEPVVRYRYEVGGRRFTGEDVFPNRGASGSRSWADAVVARYREGQAVTAFHDPDAPADAFLERHLSFTPYMGVCFPMLFLLVGATVVTLVGPGRSVPPPRQSPDGHVELVPQRPLARRKRLAMVMAVLWYGVGAIAAGHYLVFAETIELEALVTLPVYGAVGFVPLGTLGYYWMVGHSVGEARVLLDTDRFGPGDAFTVVVEQPARMGLNVRTLELALVCRSTRKRGKSISTHTTWQSRQTLMEDQIVREGEPLSAMQSFTLPEDEPVSSPPGHRGYPHHQWRLEVRTKLAGRPDYRANYPLRVERA